MKDRPDFEGALVKLSKKKGLKKKHLLWRVLRLEEQVCRLQEKLDQLASQGSLEDVEKLDKNH